MTDVIFHNSPADYVRSLFSYFSVDMTTNEEWENLLKVDASDKATLTALFREAIDFSKIEEPAQHLLIQSMTTVLNDVNCDYSLIFDADEIALPFYCDKHDNERLRQWVLIMWEVCTGKEFDYSQIGAWGLREIGQVFDPDNLDSRFQRFGADVLLLGTQRYEKSMIEFAEMLRSSEALAHFELKLEPDNSNDRIAVVVQGSVGLSARYNLGYLPRQETADVAKHKQLGRNIAPFLIKVDVKPQGHFRVTARVDLYVEHQPSNFIPDPTKTYWKNEE